MTKRGVPLGPVRKQILICFFVDQTYVCLALGTEKKTFFKNKPHQRQETFSTFILLFSKANFIRNVVGEKP